MPPVSTSTHAAAAGRSAGGRHRAEPGGQRGRDPRAAGGVTLAISPYAANPDQLLTAARAAEHEYLLSIPMEPQGFPLNDPGPQALMTTLPPEENRQRLDWALSRIAGYVGATGALGRCAVSGLPPCRTR